MSCGQSRSGRFNHVVHQMSLFERVVPMLGNRRPLTFYISIYFRPPGKQDFCIRVTHKILAKHSLLRQPYELTGKRHHLYGGTRPENPIDSSGPRQRSWLLQPKFEHSSSGETYLLPPSAGSGSRGAETAPGRSTDGCSSSSTGNGADD